MRARRKIDRNTLVVDILELVFVFGTNTAPCEARGHDVIDFTLKTRKCPQEECVASEGVRP